MEKAEALIPEGLCATVYTQWSDVEEEVNGVYTYDRECQKIWEDAIQRYRKKLSKPYLLS